MEMEYQPEEILCFMFIGLLIGTFITYLISRYALFLPYTVVCFVIGILLSLGAENANFETFGKSIHEWEHIGPHLILYIFLPALLFGEAMTVNIHHLKRTFWSAVLLAGPGSLLGTFLLAASIKFMLPYNWSWQLCYTFGAILCATDPVAVVALLKEAGAGPRFTMLIIQEALLNDGAALVLFNLFFDSLRVIPHENYNELGIAIYFIKVLVISPLLGAALGLGAVGLMRLATNRMKSDDTIIQVSLSLCCAYMSFFIAEYLVNVSGVLCCCTAGFVLAWLGPPLILQPETMHSVWSTIEWMGNTILFLLAGLLLGTIDIPITALDIGMVFLTYLLLQLIRVVMVLIFYPALSRIGYGVSIPECIFLSWGGLRGAVGIALSLVLKQSARSHEITTTYADSTRVFFLVGGVAGLTLIVNATLAKPLLYALKLVDTTAEEIKIMQHYARKRIHMKIHILLNELKEKLPAFDEDLIHEFCRAITGINKTLFPTHTHSKDIITQLRNDPASTASNNKMISKSNNNKDFNTTSILDTSKDSKTKVRFIEEENENENENGKVEEEDKEEKVNQKSSTSKQNSHHHHLPLPSSTSSSSSSTYNKTPEKGSSSEEEKIITLSPSTLSALQTELFLYPSYDPYHHHHHHEKKNPRREINQRLLIHVRIAFLEVVKAVYWKHIETGKLARYSTAAVLLLYSIDVGHDTVHTPGLQDWDALQPALNPSNYRWILVATSLLDLLRTFCLTCLATMHWIPNAFDSKYITKKIEEVLEYKLLERKLYILSSFIEAHSHAQRKIPFYLGEEEVADTPEEAMVIEESNQSVLQAKLLINAIDPDCKRFHVSKMVARMVLATQEDMVKTFQEEGILCPRDAEMLLEETHRRSRWLKREWFHRIVDAVTIEGRRSAADSVVEDTPMFEQYIRRRATSRTTLDTSLESLETAPPMPLETLDQLTI